MNIFISWSGKRSGAVANLLNRWIKLVIQATQPWISTQDIQRGTLWSTAINNKLSETTIGIVCITKENKDAPWILFEAGALFKGLTSNRVCTFLVDLENTELKEPLAQFNHTCPTESDMKSLIKTLNNALPDSNKLSDEILIAAFDTYWPQFQADFEEIKLKNPSDVQSKPREQNDILNEILESTRTTQKRLYYLEGKFQELQSNSHKSQGNASFTPFSMPGNAAIDNDFVFNLTLDDINLNNKFEDTRKKLRSIGASEKQIEFAEEVYASVLNQKSTIMHKNKLKK